MIERRGRLRFALKSAARGRVREIVGQKFDRDRPIELRVERAVDRSHPARANWRVDDVHADRQPGETR